MLIIGHGYSGDVARHFWLDGKLPRRDEGIVRRFEMLGVVPIQVTARHRESADNEPERDRERMPPPKPCSRLMSVLVVLVRKPIVMQRRRIDNGALVSRMFLRRRLPRADCVRNHASALARPGAGDKLVVRMLLQELFGVVTAFRFPWHSRVPSDFRCNGGVPLYA